MKPATVPGNAVPPNVQHPSEAVSRLAGLRSVSLASGWPRRSPDREMSRTPDIRFIRDTQAPVEGTKVKLRWRQLTSSHSIMKCWYDYILYVQFLCQNESINANNHFAHNNTELFCTRTHIEYSTNTITVLVIWYLLHIIFGVHSAPLDGLKALTRKCLYLVSLSPNSNRKWPNPANHWRRVSCRIGRVSLSCSLTIRLLALQMYGQYSDFHLETNYRVLAKFSLGPPYNMTLNNDCRRSKLCITSILQ